MEKVDERTTTALGLDDQIIENISVLIQENEQAGVLNLLYDFHPADQAKIIEHLPFEEARKLFLWLSAIQGSEILPELEDVFRNNLLEYLSPDQIAEIVDEMDTDDAADVLADLPEDVAAIVLPDLEDEEEVRELLRYDEESAGGIMASEYIVVPKNWTIAQVTEEVRRLKDEVDPVYVVYVTDPEEKLVGLLTLKDILLSAAKASVASVMEEDVIAVTADIDQEDVARIMERYDLTVLPVVDNTNRLIGRITIDDIVDVIREEAEEDIQRMSGISKGDEALGDSVWRISRGRLSWLIIGLAGAIFAGFVIHSYEDSLEAATILSVFIPVVMAMAGNAGIQSSAISVQGLAAGDIWMSDFRSRIFKELLVSVINGFAISLLIGSAIYLFTTIGIISDENGFKLAVTVAITIVIVIIFAATLGSIIPLVLHKMRIDPAIATGPFVTTSNDIFGLIIYFIVASKIYLS